MCILSFPEGVGDEFGIGSTYTDNNLPGQYPYFNDAENGNYGLSAYSPLVGAGANFYTINGEFTIVASGTDLLGNPRPLPSGTNVDIGAYENSNSTPQYNPNKYVNGNTGGNNNPGTIDSPFETITFAIDAAQSGDIIHVAPGVYEGAGEAYVNFEGLQNLTLIGEDMETTIIQGPWNNSSVVTIPTGSDGAVLKNFTIQNGVGQEGLYGGSGGGVYVDALATLENLIIQNNTSANRGGGIYFEGSSGNSVLKNSIVRNNSSEHGGGIAIHNGAKPKIINTLIEFKYCISKWRWCNFSFPNIHVY